VSLRKSCSLTFCPQVTLPPPPLSSSRAYNPLLSATRYGGRSRTEHTGGGDFYSPLGSSRHHHGNRGYHHPSHHQHQNRRCREVPHMANGRMLCVDDTNPYYGGGVGGPGIRCTPVCDPGHAFYQKFTSRPPTYVCNSRRVDWEIRRFIPDCSPAYPAAGTACQPGWEARNGEEGPQCVACPPGMYRSPGSGRLCQLCPKGTYAGGFGSSECSSCPRHHTTRGLGSRRPTQCHYRRPEGMQRSSARRSSQGFLFYNQFMKPSTTNAANSAGNNGDKRRKRRHHHHHRDHHRKH